MADSNMPNTDKQPQTGSHRYAVKLAIPAAVLLGTAALITTDSADVAHSSRTSAMPIEFAESASPEELPQEVQIALSTELELLPEDEARKRNEAIPFVTRTPDAARSFRSSLAGLERDRALDCLAAAAWYEAGGDGEGQRAVMQVVLNRTRNVLFPNSVCEVVFQGSERQTGCQFTFTCDGAMKRRKPSDTAWRLARERAKKALAGSVYKPVGYATHYHTNWVMPLWNRNLDKIAQVDTHLFYRWRAGLGQPHAFRQASSSTERSVPEMAFLGASHRGEDKEMLASIAEQGDMQLLTARTGPLPPAIGTPEHKASFARTRAIPADAHPGRLAIDAVRSCEGESRCFIAAYANGAAKQHISLANLSASKPDFVYVQVLRDRKKAAYWNCERFPRESAAECIPSAGVASLLPRSE